MHFGNLPDLVITLNEGTGMLSGNFHHGFIGHHFNHHIIFSDKLAGTRSHEIFLQGCLLALLACCLLPALVTHL